MKIRGTLQTNSSSAFEVLKGTEARATGEPMLRSGGVHQCVCLCQFISCCKAQYFQVLYKPEVQFLMFHLNVSEYQRVSRACA